jgi:murein DD-endopeptidase MepM/ murein hydrolase activator NlpD
VSGGVTIIGTPHVGTHTLGNWQSDNADDLATPVGTPVLAAIAGKVTRVGPLPGATAGGQFAGSRVQIDGANNSVWYGHLSSTSVHVGDTVKVGDVIGASGSANGVAHLHFAVERGSPAQFIKSVLGGGSNFRDIGGGEISSGSGIPVVGGAIDAASGAVSGAIDFAKDPQGAIESVLQTLFGKALSTAGKWLLYGVLIFGGAAIAVYGLVKAAGAGRNPTPEAA